ncbi:MAG: hypothetical protein L3J24_03920 [Xanthomonadales bacterium]|nr:hypothetical protein [Xanthomonadales bacterium]
MKWKEWAAWLYNKPELFENHKQYIHVDQIAMGLGLVNGAVPYKSLPSNYNCPTHEAFPQRSFLPSQSMSILHYHKGITAFGTLGKDTAANEPIRSAIEKANRAISERRGFVYFKDYRKNQFK